MSAVFTKTAKSSAIGSFQSATIVALIGSIFGVVAAVASEMPVFMKVIFSIVAFGCLLGVAAYVRQGIRYLKSGKPWRVEVTSRKLSWQSPVEDTLASFELPLSEILTLRHVMTKVAGRKTVPSHEYTIELRNGQIIKVSDQISGIHPEKVFEAMRQQGVPFAKELVRTKEELRQRREQKRARRRKSRANRRLERTSVVSARKKSQKIVPVGYLLRISRARH